MDVNIRPPLLLRVYTYAFGVVWCGLVAVGLVKAAPKPGAVILVFMLVFGVTLCWRMGGLSAVGEGDTLVIRNIYRTRRVPAADITGLRTGTAPMQPFGRTVYVVTDADAIALDACSMWSFRKRSERHRQILETWLQGHRGGAEAGTS